MPNCKTVVPYRGSPEQEERLRQVIAEHRGQPGATMPVLQAAQEIFGYLPEEVQIMVAEGLDIPLSEVYGVASFYAQFSMNPKGKYQISVCLGTACYVKGAAAVLNAVEQKLGIVPGAITPDGKPANLKYIDFIKVHTALNVSAGALGENSTEVFGYASLDPEAAIQ